MNDPVSKKSQGSFFAGVFGLVIIVCIIILTVNSCAIRKHLIEGEDNGEDNRVQVERVEKAEVDGSVLFPTNV